MFRKKHQWKIAEFQWLDIFVLAKASGWLSDFPVQCVDGWLKSCLTSWPVGSLTIDSVSAEQSVNESIYCGSVVSYGPIKRSACVFLCVYYWLPLTYVAGFGSVLTEHLQSWRLFFSFPFLLFGAERHAVLTSWPCSTFLCLIVLSLSHSHMYN